MKKFISIVLAAAMLISTMTTIAFAVDETEYDYEMNYGETIALSLDSNCSVCIKFVPQKTGKYVFSTASSNFTDTGAWLTDSNGEDVDVEYYDDIDLENGNYDFFMKCKLEAGKAYYINVFIHHGDEGSFELTIECGHYYKDGVCVVCGIPCNHELTEELYYAFCECGENFVGKDIHVGDECEYKYNDSDVNNESGWYRFIPEESGVYYIQSFSNTETIDPFGCVFDSEGEWIASNDDHDGTLDFKAVCFLEAGKTYYISVNSYEENSSFIFKLERMIHVTDEGEIHSDFELTEETYSNCTEHGYSEGLYCNDCEEYVYGHEEYELEPDWHIDDDWDYFCDLCGTEIEFYEDCECTCHISSPFFTFIWRIANFFHSIFGISRECECGVWHYDIY